MYAGEDPEMEKSMDLDKSLDMEIGSKREYQKAANNSIQSILGYPYIENDEDVYVPGSTGKSYLSTVFEEDEEEVEEVQKDVIEEKIVCVTNLLTATNKSTENCSDSKERKRSRRR
ncbi:putative kinesin-like protein [Helianthus debilis subsp. tardiflorus]